MVTFIGFLLIGKLIIYVLQKLPFQKTFIGHLFLEGKFLGQLFSCDFCLGCWVFIILTFFVKEDMLSEIGLQYVPVVSEIVTGIFSSFVTHIFSIGWNTKFGTIVLE